MISQDAPAQKIDTDVAVVLGEEYRGENKYFIIERRRPQGYDSNFPGNGVLIWRVQKGVVNGVAHMGAPDLTPGGSGVWTSGMQTPILKWANGESTGITITVNAENDGSMRVAGGEAVIQPSRTRHLRLFHGGCGTTPVDSGLPMTGIFYGGTSEANLEWNRYNGLGQQISDPAALKAWGANTGNLIGRGWGSMLHLLGCGDGVI